MRFRIDGEIFEDARELVDSYANENYYWDDDYFEEWVNDEYGSIEIYGHRYYAFEILDNMASEELHDLRNDYCKAENDRAKDDAVYELNHAEPGDEIDFQGYTIEVLADEEDVTEEETDTTTDTVAVRAETIEAVRIFIDEQKILQAHVEAENKKNEDEMMTLFQVIK